MTDTSQDDALPDNPLPRLHERKRRLDTLSADEKKALAARGYTEEWLYQAEQEIQALLRLEHEHATLYGTSAVQDAAQRLGVHPSTVHRMREAYRVNPTIHTLIPNKRGASKGQRLTEEQQLVIATLYLRPVPIQIGARKIIPGRSTYKYIHQVLTAFYPPQVSEDTVYRFINGLREDYGLMVDMARRGEDWIRDHIMPTPAVNVERANQIWQLDARPLPIYVRHKVWLPNEQGVLIEQEIRLTPSLLLIADHKSHYPIRARLVPRAEIDKNGKLKRADVRNQDVGILIASAIYELGIRPEMLYTDNGSSIVGVGEMLANLLGDGHLLTEFTRSIPGRPRGRGAIEKMLGTFDRVLIDLPANFVPNTEDPKKKDPFTMIRNAQQDTNMVYLEGHEGLQGYLDTFIEQLRNEPKRENGTETRRQLWTGTGALRAFPIRELMRLLPPEHKVSRDAAIDNWKVTFLQKEHGDDFEPRLDSDRDWDMWLLASSRPERIPLRAMKIDTGWKIEVCLERDTSEPYWCELILKDQQMIDKDYRNERIDSSLQRLRQQHKHLSDTLDDAAQQLGLKRIAKQPGGGPVRLDEQSTHDPATTNPQPAPPPATNVSVRDPNQQKPVQPPKPKGRHIDVERLMHEAEREMENGEG